MMRKRNGDGLANLAVDVLATEDLDCYPCGACQIVNPNTICPAISEADLPPVSYELLCDASSRRPKLNEVSQLLTPTTTTMEAHIDNFEVVGKRRS
jgi:hypothetical protein